MLCGKPLAPNYCLFIAFYLQTAIKNPLIAEYLHTRPIFLIERFTQLIHYPDILTLLDIRQHALPKRKVHIADQKLGFTKTHHALLFRFLILMLFHPAKLLSLFSGCLTEFIELVLQHGGCIVCNLTVITV